MRFMKRIGLFIIGLSMTSLAMSQTVSPELISSAGDSFINGPYQLDWSLGECATATYAAGSYSLTQGLHQNYYIISATEDLAKDINMSVYPNPTTDFITIRRNSKNSVLLTITDINGKILQQAKLTREQEQLNFLNYPKGVYFLSIFQVQEKQLIKSFKIIKN